MDRIERMLEFISNDIVRMQAAQPLRDEQQAKQAKLHEEMREETRGERRELRGVQRQTEETLQRVTAEFAQEHQLLLKAQVVMTDGIDKLTEAQRHTDGRLNALIAVVDGIVRRPPA